MSKRNSDTHRNKMLWKRELRTLPCGYFFHPAPLTRISNPMYGFNASVTRASINRRTGNPHEHKREMARRLAA